MNRADFIRTISDHHSGNADEARKLYDVLVAAGAFRTPGTREHCLECHDKAHDGKYTAAGRDREKPCPVMRCPVRDGSA